MTRYANARSVSRLGRAAVLFTALLSGSASAAGSEVGAALASMNPEIVEVRKSCDEPVKVDTNEVALGHGVAGVHVVLTSPVCLGQWGQYDYLLVRDLDGHWRTILGGPGPIRVTRRSGAQVARIEVSALMRCELVFTWNGVTYVRHGSSECAGGRRGAEWAILDRVMRAAEHR